MSHSGVSRIAPVTAENETAYAAHLDCLREQAAAPWQFGAQSLRRNDWEQLRPMLHEHGYRLYTLGDRPEKVQKLREEGVEIDEARLNKIIQTVGPGNMALFQGFRISDSAKPVILKIVVNNPTSRESEILEYLNTPELRACPSNLTIPLLDAFEITYCGTPLRVLVMEDCSEHAFSQLDSFCQSKEDWYRFLLRIFEGYNFMHDLGIAHLDVHSRNILWKLDSKSLEDVHICDFGGSQHFSEPTEEALCYHPTHLHEFPESPYFIGPHPFNPFAADVYGLGLTCLQCEEMHERFPLPPLLDLLTKMSSITPQERPTLAQTLNHLRKILLEAILYPERAVPHAEVGVDEEVADPLEHEDETNTAQIVEDDRPEKATEENTEGASEGGEEAVEAVEVPPKEVKEQSRDESAIEKDNAILAEDPAQSMGTATIPAD